MKRFDVSCVVFCGIIISYIGSVQSQTTQFFTTPPLPQEVGGLDNWTILAIVLPCLYVGLGLIFLIPVFCFCCRGRAMSANNGAECDGCCGPMCEPQGCYGSGSCCGPVCHCQGCCGPSCCGPCCYQRVEVPAPVVKSAPYPTRGPIWPQQQGGFANFGFPSTGDDHHVRGMGLTSGGYGFSKSVDGNYSDGKPLFRGGEAQCGPCGQR